jgi:hypothetical protein
LFVGLNLYNVNPPPPPLLSSPISYSSTCKKIDTGKEFHIREGGKGKEERERLSARCREKRENVSIHTSHYHYAPRIQYLFHLRNRILLGD